MAEPKYYADDKAILDEMIRLEKQKQDAQAMGILGAGTIGLDAAGLKALGTMGRIGSKMDAFDELSMNPLNTSLIDDRILSRDQIADQIILNTKNENFFGFLPSKVREAVKIIGMDQEIAKLVQKKNPAVYKRLQDELDLDRKLASEKNMSVEEYQDLNKKFFPRNGLLDEYSGSGYTGQDILKQRELTIKEANEKLRQQRLLDYENALKTQKNIHRGYGELAAATIPFVGGADMMYSAYQDYVNAQNQIEKMMKQATPEQKAEFEKKLKEERMKPYQLKDSDFRYK